ncbi:MULTISPECIES: hypothetical protein [Meiothermus]|jgi:hypothetical protein|uniref:hypothetical protein n=1 Tax=Meiothermus TaxID=65551 RepID=UPI001020369F|nr:MULTISPECIES: hypothetical protein [Meiothermus]MCL6531407.1 hypothetical protein [Meiothermus ruber]RYM39468.1 hypothetical protein EWH23_02970 [Meiothermus sp. PNK-Is4]
MRIRGLLVLVVVMGFALAQGEVMTPGGLPTPLGPLWRPLPAEECNAVWTALKEEVKAVTLRGLPEPKTVNCLFFNKAQRNNALGWEMGNKTLDQVFTEGWERQRGVFEMLRNNSNQPRAVGRFSFQPTPKSFVSVFFGFSPLFFRPIYDLIYALERENDVVLVEPRL